MDRKRQASNCPKKVLLHHVGYWTQLILQI
jgi:hypothetical protein